MFITYAQGDVYVREYDTYQNQAASHLVHVWTLFTYTGDNCLTEGSQDRLN